MDQSYSLSNVPLALSINLSVSSVLLTRIQFRSLDIRTDVIAATKRMSTCHLNIAGNVEESKKLTSNVVFLELAHANIIDAQTTICRAVSMVRKPCCQLYQNANTYPTINSNPHTCNDMTLSLQSSKICIGVVFCDLHRIQR